MNLSERIRIIFKEIGVKQKEFAASLGVTEGYASKLLKGYTETISESLALLIEAKYGYSSKWIMFGEGDPKEKEKKNTFTRARTKHLLDQLDENELMAVVAFVNSMEDVKRIFASIQKADDEQTAAIVPFVAEETAEYNCHHEVPLLGKVACGMPIIAIQEYGKKVKASVSCDCALELVGDSMAPDYTEGDIVLISRQNELLDGELGIIMRMEGPDIAEVTFKKFYQEGDRVILKPINKNHAEQIYNKVDIVIYGKVVGKV